MISRRQLLHISTLLAVCYPIANFKYFAMADYKIDKRLYPFTKDLLKEAYWEEVIANKHYDGYCQKAISDNYPNIAYLFHSLSISEKIHAENYKQLITLLGSTLEIKEIPINVSDTKKNLNTASIKELEKINKFYPELLKKLSSESHDQAVVNCMYSWKSHQQHEELISDIKKYSGWFFKPLAKKIERMEPNYYVCEICGSTADEKPSIPCEICNYPMYHYKNIERPKLLTK